MKIFEFYDEFFEDIVVSKRNDDSFQIVFFVTFTIQTCGVIFGKLVTTWAYFWMWLEFFFATFAQICASDGAVDTLSWENIVYNIHRRKGQRFERSKE